MRTALLLTIPVLATGLPHIGSADDRVSFNRDVRPILASKCFHCHGPAEASREADLRFDREESATADRDGTFAIKPGDPTASEAWKRMSSADPDTMMPPPDSKKELSPGEIEIIRRWIEQGAEWQGHWSFIPPKRPQIPSVRQKDRLTGEIDAFIVARLEREGLKLSPEAARELLIRRVTFDLTGLPPTLEQIDDFVNDTADNAYEKVVDRLLASDAYAERMTLMWMDAARYGDSSVFHADGPRDMWPWRDWVINAYRDNKPFDRFTVEQLAGDLIPDATVHQQIASGFNRNHGTTDEGGAIDEEYRVEYIVDRIKTTSTIWLGLTMECGQCHDHKYDPITQREYYQFFAFFNQSSDRGMQTRNGNADPKIDVPNFATMPKVDPLKQTIVSKQADLDAYAKTTGPAFEKWVAQASADVDQALPVPSDLLAHFPLDEGKGRKVASAIESVGAGQLKGKPMWADGKFGKCLKFDASNFVDIAGVGDFERTDPFSYGCWLQVDKNGGGAPIARMNNGNAFRGYDLHLSGRRVEVHIINTWPTNAIKVRTKNELAADTWQHVFVTYDGSSKAAGVKVYFDGKEQPWDIEQDGLTQTIRAKTGFYLGRRNGGSNFKGMVDDVRIYPRALAPSEVAALAGSDPIKPILALEREKRSAEQTAILQQHYLVSHDGEYKQRNSELGKLRSELAQLTKPISSVMVMRDLPKPRMTYILDRGNYASPKKDQPVEAAVPAALGSLPDGAPRSRLGMAQWLVNPDHPLTARVTVNRYWQILFGTGLVKTAEDFGSQGEWPSHPELLDWLAADFVESGWNVKRMIKQMVMSNTYRQTSQMTTELRERDPDNRLLARGPRFRLQGEFIRDHALAISGLLIKKVGGSGVKPYQPPGLWNEVSLSGNVRFVQDKGDNLYRRSMYTYWKRSAPAPSMLIFDTPTREKCVVRRPRTNTPLQALVVMNDPQFVEASRVLAERIMKQGGSTVDERVEFAYRCSTARRPNATILKLLTDTYKIELAEFRKSPERAKQFLSVGEYQRDESLDLAEHAAWSVVASMILNLDATLTRG